ncbi:MAG: threonine--tRNA ligase [Dehalococcoidia bacterium]|jgi:threonyl-tRNA synthetase|nr:threonine--tRNA ligase [Dehalococcoidia bacterium]MDW8008716.1 threonine--tRNA ligase [Chloroflexota bacterium]
MSKLDELPKEERLYRMRHSAAHIMAEAVLKLFPGAKLGIGPPIDTGFYYDFDLPRPLTPDDLPRIEELMRERIASDVPFVHEEISKEEARRLFADQTYKLELIEEIEDDRVSLYRHADFVDLCQGPHVERTGQVPPFKLLSVAGAYWRGDERRPMLQRIYGALFETQEELEEYLRRLEEAQRRDHRRLGRELDLFSFHEEYGPGLVYWHPKGARVRTIIEDFWRREHFRRGYELVYTPHIGRATLWQTSGHLDFYAENMYSPMDVDGQAYYLKPMNCPFHIQIYKSRVRSYRELPIRLAELGTVYRYERSGVLHGLLRVRGFTQDDAHIFCRPDQVQAEIEGCLDFMLLFFEAFGFREFRVYLSTRDAEGKYAGSPEDWQMAEATLRRAVEDRGLSYQVDEGGAVFYGPKIDVKLVDAIGREWQCTTVQFDFNLPERFDMTYVAADGSRQRPYMVHRAMLGSMERFLGVLIEHYAGAFPTWLAPVQAVVIPIADRHLPYARQVAERLREADLRVEVDDRQERMQAKIRDAQLQKVPYMLIVGDREAQAGGVAVRLRSGEDLGTVPLEDLLSRLVAEARQAP